MTGLRCAVVTGAAGFIGSHMVDVLLDEGVEVRAVDNLSTGRLENLEHRRGERRLAFEHLDVREVAASHPVFRGADAVFHFAGLADIVPSIEQPTEYMSTNVMGTVRVLEAARHAGVSRFVYAASSSCYGLATQVPTPESATITPQYPYALSKYLGEEAALHWAATYKLPVVTLRIFNAYGPRSRTSGVYGAVFGVFLAQKLAGKPFTVVGDGTQRRDFVFVTDVARAFLLAAQADVTPATYNVGGGNPQSINRLVELLGGEVLFLPKRPGEPDCTWADIGRISGELGWLPKVSFEEGVTLMLARIADWRSAPVWDADSIARATRDWFIHLGR